MIYFERILLNCLEPCPLGNEALSYLKLLNLDVKKTLSIPSPNQNSVNLKWLKRLSQGCQLSHYQAAKKKKNMKVDLFCKPEITISNAKLITKSTRYFGREFYHYKQTSWPEISYIKLCVTYLHAVTQWSEPLVFMVNSRLIMFGTFKWSNI